MARAKYVVDLAEEERVRLRTLLRRGRASVRMVARSRVLLRAEEGYTDAAIAAVLDVGTATVGRIRKRFVERGLEQALREQPRPGQRRKLSGKQEAHVIAVACTTPPEGHGRWTLRLLAGKVVELGFAPSISPEDGAAGAQKNELKPWQREEWCIPTVTAEFVAAMEDVLDLYGEPYDPRRPTVCFDETSTQLIAERRIPIQPIGDGESGLTMSTDATARAICSCSASPCGVGGMWRSPSNGGWRTLPTRCGGWWTKPTPRRRGFGSCWTTSIPTGLHRCTKPLPRWRQGGY